ncbi:hypothetical protein ACFOEE_17890 [Pseudoalteromonas fenneropenaei]|uniref:Orphan protein n=1 Tax=Pseudoalteromonas fenneropenaei TaxID=1737459 RepID=A0ABV7CP07_9GAMM
MKKLSAVQKKQQALVMAVAEAIEAEAKLAFPGMLQCWFSMEYHLFPGSLLMRLQFSDAQSLANAEPELAKWRKRLSGMMLKKGVILKDMRQHLVFTLSGPED